jgi:hypothetical protein
MNNIGNSSRLAYDNCAYPDRLSESVSPGVYRLQPYYNYNSDACMNLNGPRGQGYGVATTVENAPAMSQQLVDVESVLSNRNVRTSKCKDGNVNTVRPQNVKTINPRVCENDAFPRNSRLSHPAYNYKEMPMNRFYNLHRNPQANIFYDFAKNTVLEAKDNYIYPVPIVGN